MSLAQAQSAASEIERALTGDERELIERAKRDREAFSVLYRRHYSMLAAHVYRRTGNVHATEDLVADVFLTALRTLPRYRYRGIPVRFWLLRIATNAVNRWARRQRRHAVAELPADQLLAAGAQESSTLGRIEQERARWRAAVAEAQASNRACPALL